MNDKKISFIICADNVQYYEECVRYIEELEVPDGYCTDILCIQEAASMAEGYNGGMRESDAKYKVYLHQDTFILNHGFINEILRIFTEDKRIGMIGFAGTDKISINSQGCLNWNIGNVVNYNGRAVDDTDFLRQKKERWIPVEAAAGFLLATQYDVPWREDFLDGWDYYDVSQSLEMRRRGYQVVVPYQQTAWCYHDCGAPGFRNYDLYREKLALEYPEAFGEKTEVKPQTQKEYMEHAKAVAGELAGLLAQHQYTVLGEIAGEMREKWLRNTEIREIMNLTEIYSLESAGVSGWHSEWYELGEWEQIREYYNWVRFTVLRIEYEREDERIAELKRRVESGRVSRDAIRKISAVNLSDSRKVYRCLLGERRQEPLVSVVVPTYNGADTIEKALDSILNQTYRNIEVIVVDDASTDSTREKISAYKEKDSRIKPIFLEKNRHVCYAGNIGFEHASGKYIALIGHDDLWREDKLEKQVSFLEEHPSYGLCFTWVDIIDENDREANAQNNIIYTKFNNDNLGGDRWSRKLVLEDNSFCAPSACIRAEVLQRTGYYRYALVQLQDYDLWLRVLLETDVYILQEKLTRYRRSAGEGRQISEINEETCARDSHEKQWICDTYVRNICEEKFVRIFKGDMKRPEARGEKELLCEKAFFLWERGNCFAEKWFIELLEDAECREILEEKYRFELKDFYRMNVKPMFFDESSLKILKQYKELLHKLSDEKEQNLL